MPFPTSNVRVLRELTRASFYGCDDCADGNHGALDEQGMCSCCRWAPEFRAGYLIGVST